jgi:GTPase SAR1 family protein
LGYSRSKILIVGQERFQSLSSAYYRGADCCVLVFDVTAPQTIHSLPAWIRDFIYQGKIENPEKFLFILVANKSDSSDRIVSLQQAQKASTILKELIDEICQEKGSAQLFTTGPSTVVPATKEETPLDKSISGVALRPLRSAISKEQMRLQRESVLSFHTALSDLDQNESHMIDTSAIEENGIPFFETSALTGAGVDACFQFIAEQCEPITRSQSSTTIHFVDAPVEKKNSCAC